MSEVTDLTVIEIKPEQAPALYSAGGLNGFLEQIRELAKEVPDVTTKKGRDRIGSLARMVGSSKTAIEKPGREYLKRLKEAVKPAEEELRVFTRECDAIRDAILKPRDEWEAEQERIKAEEAMNAMHAEALVMNEEFDRQRAAQIEADHEMALLMNDKFDRDREEQRRLAEQAQRERDERLKQEAAEKAKREAEERHKAELDAAARREAEEKARADAAERKRKEDADRAEREKQDAIAEEKRKAQEEADRIKREAEAKEKARLAEEQRKAEEEARRAADKEHRRTVNRRVIADLINQGIPEEFAQKALLAIAGGKVQDAHIKY
ncbi:hypothetical protein [Enterobacter roggenkampii]|uniref:hypothetical protein n=1 Tax=Enterobacter roggenkampii TaxID=1812935 RepID=UPI00079308FE|nr:hypothetical protein [Enterobacter roggenkampii]MBA7742065.1 hypothetical protein [Enterobacter roggenkampii]MBT2030167.1 hypothetical protein [Enterobacter roggenkampii]MBT2034727.1 hypothetical protein [Enterobacter roggenkampii]TWY20334.1 hypothetical protein FR969_12410 [Enterobacter roggenkampii]SAA31851.1 IgA-specific serine endopeptidase autotransporter precursor [Enterobacter roggenkampii]